MVVQPCSSASRREGMAERAEEIWRGYTNKNGEQIAGATRLHINNEFQVNSQPLGACLTPGLAVGGRAWPSFSPDHPNNIRREVWEKALCVWLNSTLGLVARWWVSSRQQKGRANLTVTTIGSIPVLDLNALTTARVEAAAAIFDEFENQSLLRQTRPTKTGFVKNWMQDLQQEYSICRKVRFLGSANCVTCGVVSRLSTGISRLALQVPDPTA